MLTAAITGICTSALMQAGLTQSPDTAAHQGSRGMGTGRVGQVSFGKDTARHKYHQTEPFPEATVPCGSWDDLARL